MEYCEFCGEPFYRCECEDDDNSDRQNIPDDKDLSNSFVWLDTNDTFELQDPEVEYESEKEYKYIWTKEEGKKTPANILRLETGNNILVIGKGFMIVGEVEVTKDIDEMDEEYVFYYKARKFNKPISLNDEKIIKLLTEYQWNTKIMKSNIRHTITRVSDELYSKIKNIIEK